MADKSKPNTNTTEGLVRIGIEPVLLSKAQMDHAQKKGKEVATHEVTVTKNFNKIFSIPVRSSKKTLFIAGQEHVIDVFEGFTNVDALLAGAQKTKKA